MNFVFKYSKINLRNLFLPQFYSKFTKLTKNLCFSKLCQNARPFLAETVIGFIMVIKMVVSGPITFLQDEGLAVLFRM